MFHLVYLLCLVCCIPDLIFRHLRICTVHSSLAVLITLLTHTTIKCFRTLEIRWPSWKPKLIGPKNRFNHDILVHTWESWGILDPFDPSIFIVWTQIRIVIFKILFVGLNLVHFGPKLHIIPHLLADSCELAIECRLGLPQHFSCRCPILNPRPVFGSSSKTSRGVCFQLFESRNELP